MYSQPSSCTYSSDESHLTRTLVHTISAQHLLLVGSRIVGTASHLNIHFLKPVGYSSTELSRAPASQNHCLANQVQALQSPW